MTHRGTWRERGVLGGYIFLDMFSLCFVFYVRMRIASRLRSRAYQAGTMARQPWDRQSMAASARIVVVEVVVRH